MDCRPLCGACCIAPSITSPISGMPNGKPAGVACVQLDTDFRCKLFGLPERHGFCAGLQPNQEMCGDENRNQTRAYAIEWLARLEVLTTPWHQ